MKRMTMIISALLLSVTSTQLAFAKQEQMNQEHLMRFSKAISYIKQYSAQDTSDKIMLENALHGMLQGLDAHSNFLDEDKYQTFNENSSGKFAGLGIEVTIAHNLIKVVSPLDDSPAAKAGIRAGDMIVAINHKPVTKMSLDEAVKLMRGKPDTQIHLTIARKDNAQPIQMDLTRQFINVTSVKSEMLSHGYGYLRISQFQANTSKYARKAIAQLEQKNNGKLKGLILDLRNNPGGLLSAAVTISDLFIDSEKVNHFNSVIVSTKGRAEDSNMTSKATRGDILMGAPLIVLINAGSASAAEIVSGALQDYKRALVLGTRSFGKGSVQSILPLDKKHAIKLTTALYYTPANRKIQAQGIEPDIVVENLDMKPLKTDAIVMQPWREADLKGHIKNDAANANTKTLQKSALLKKDYQLNQAYIVLKALHITNQRISQQLKQDAN